MTREDPWDEAMMRQVEALYRVGGWWRWCIEVDSMELVYRGGA
jgi:hypothetical protein